MKSVSKVANAKTLIFAAASGVTIDAITPVSFNGNVPSKRKQRQPSLRLNLPAGTQPLGQMIER